MSPRWMRLYAPRSARTSLALDCDGQRVTLCLADSVKPAQVNQARRLVETHDPAQLTPDQQAAADRAIKLQQSRGEAGADELRLADFDGKDVLLIQLARKILWLEREVRALRSG
ncbi:MAG: hypothetical protein JNM70_18325 [Anaerolineae bacterium]|nr:hypothetical protein [Anaerolineae bacterium]